MTNQQRQVATRPTQALEGTADADHALIPWDRVAARRDLIRRQLAPGASDLELEYFLETARELGLSPLSREIYAVMRSSREQVAGRWQTIPKMVIQIGIDGYRSIGARTGRFGGMRGPYWCGPDGAWKDVWLSEEPPAAAKVEIVLTDTRETVTGIATWREFAQKTPARAGGKDPQTGRTWEARPEGLSDMWEKMGAHMLAKCAEAQAWRKALPSQTQHLFAARAIEFAPDPSPPPVTIHLGAGDDIETFDAELARAGWTHADANREFGTDDLAAEAERRGGWAEMTMALRANITKQMRDAFIDESLPPTEPSVRASDLLYRRDEEPARTPASSDAAFRERIGAVDETSPPASIDARGSEPEGERASPGEDEQVDHSGDESITGCSYPGCTEAMTRFGPNDEPLCDAHAELAAGAEPETPTDVPAMPRARNAGEFAGAAFQVFTLRPANLEEILGADWRTRIKPEAYPEAWTRLAAASVPFEQPA